jgi:hypothetical protein
MQPVPPSEPFVAQAGNRSTDRRPRSKNRSTDPSPMPPAPPVQEPHGSAETPVTDPDVLPRERRIAERAYGLFLERGRAEGGDIDDWLEAERQVDGAVDEPAR